MSRFGSFLLQERSISALVPIAIVLLASWLANLNGGYFNGEWTLATLLLGTLLLIAALTGVFGATKPWWNHLATGFLAAYAAWSLFSWLWSPNRSDAWEGTSLTLLYLIAFLTSVSFVSFGASRRHILAASVLGPAVIAALTLWVLDERTGDLFDNYRLIGSMGYHNGEAAFLLLPFWVAIYLAGSRRVSPILRGVILAGALLSASVAVLTQSRGAMVAMAVSIPIYFLFSGHRLRGVVALLPIVVSLYLTFPGLNQVYLALLQDQDAVAALRRIVPIVWLTAAAAGLYGLLWGLIDRQWKPRTSLVRVAGGLVVAVCVVGLFVGFQALNDRVGDPIAWGAQRWEAFKTDDTTGVEQSRYLSASGSGRYALWQVAWKDFASHPFLGVGTHNYEATYYQLRSQVVGPVRQPHMLPLEVLAERGVVGGLLFFGFLAVCVGAGLIQSARRFNAEGRAQAGALIAATSYWFLHSSAEWFWQLPAITLPAIVYLAMLTTPWERSVPTPSPWSLRLIGIAIALVAMILVVPLYMAANYAQRANAAPNPQTGLRLVETAQAFNPVDPDLRQQEAELALRAEDFSRATEAYRETIELNPEHYAPRALLAFFYQVSGDPEKALPLYREALELNPLDEEIPRRIELLEAETDPSSTGPQNDRANAQ